jgi:hypothetical protein
VLNWQIEVQALIGINADLNDRTRKVLNLVFLAVAVRRDYA